MKMAGLILVSACFSLAGAACTDAQENEPTRLALNTPAAAAPVPPSAPLSAEDEDMYRAAAAAAWGYMDRYYQPATGFVNATPEWAYTTIWDVGGQLLAFLSAKELGLLTPEEHHERTQRTLDTLEKVRLFRDVAFNKTYSTTDGSIGMAGQPNGSGWSATDLGRLLVALRVLSEREPRYAEQSLRIVGRLQFREIVKDGYVHGQLIGTKGKPWTFQEGRIGYEQYVAAGFHAWGARVDKALDINTNARPVEVMGVQILADNRKLDRLLSEPFILYGLELGMPAEVQRLAQAVLDLQEKRYRETKQVTIVSEDAVAVKPEYFYYYCAYCDGKAFMVDLSAPGTLRNEPRWVSTKAAFGWNALLPSEYTRLAQDHVMRTLDPQHGWASGVYEKTGESTRTYDINTAAVILEVAAYHLRGRKALIQPR